jgi:hypothetical protein
MAKTARRVVKNTEDMDNRSRAGSKGRRSGSKDGSKAGSKGSRASRTSRSSRTSKDRRRSRSRDGSRGSLASRASKTGVVLKPAGPQRPRTRVVAKNATKTKAKSAKTKVASKSTGRVAKAKPARVTKAAKATKDDTPVETVEESQNDADAVESSETKSTDTTETIKTRFDNHSERLAELDKQIDALRRERRAVFRKMLNAHKSDVKRAEKKKKKSGHKGGFVQKKKPVGGGLAKFLGVDDGTEFTSPGLTSKFWQAMRSKNLVSPDDGRVFKVNKEVQDVFGVPNSAKRSKVFNDPKGFNFTTYQRYIVYAEKNNNGEYSVQVEE